MTKRNIFILFFIFGAAYFMAACEPPAPALVPGACVYDSAAMAPQGCGSETPLVTCRDNHIGFPTDCADGSINPPASCPEGVSIPVPGVDCAIVANGEDQIPGNEDDLTYTGKCTLATGVDYYAFGDCSEGGGDPVVYSNKYSCEQMAGGTFECLL